VRRCSCVCRLCASNTAGRGAGVHQHLNTAQHIGTILHTSPKKPLQLATSLPSRPGAPACLQEGEEGGMHHTSTTPTGRRGLQPLRHLPHSPPLTPPTHIHTHARSRAHHSHTHVCEVSSCLLLPCVPTHTHHTVHTPFS
jgi:hypothetical protein